MVNTVNELIKEVDNVIEVCTNELFTSETISMMGDSEFDMMKSCFKLLNLSKEVMLKQATMMEEQNRKLDIILKRLKTVARY